MEGAITLSGIYIHIPFCSRRCHYCDFYFVTNDRLAEDYIDAAIKEIEFRSSASEIRTIYFGGGTPSMLPPRLMERLIQKIYALWPVSADAEITLEANPEDIHQDNLNAWRDIGVNRLSIGLQSFDDMDLKWMNRTHTGKEAIQSVMKAADSGFRNISIDLIFGLPNMNVQTWEQTLKHAANLPVQHISAYALTVEPRTPLHQMVRKKMVIPPDPDLQAAQYMLLMDLAPSLGFEQYEISNFARDGHYSKHNSSYWNYIPYIGIGPSAHSFDGRVRSFHEPRLTWYLKDPLKLEEEVLTEEEQFNEFMYISLRKNEGINLQILANKFGQVQAGDCISLASASDFDGLIYVTDKAIQLTNLGRLQADRLAMAFFKI